MHGACDRVLEASHVGGDTIAGTHLAAFVLKRCSTTIFIRVGM